MNEIKIENICGVDCYEKNGIAYLELEAISRGLGFTQIAKSGNEVIRWERVRKYLKELGVPTCGDRDFESSGKEGLPEYISENIFYRLSMKAENKTAEAFQAKVADEILPTIRRTGGYVANEDVFIDTYLPYADDGTKALFKATLTTVRKQNEVIRKQKEQIEEQQPLVDFATHVSQSKDTIDMDEMAKIAQNENINIGRNRLIKWLKEKKILKDNRTPYQTYIERGYFDVVETKKETMYGVLVFPKTVITGKGQLWVIEKLRAEYC